MKYFIGLCRLIEGFLYIFLPLVVLYWSLNLVSFDFIKPLVSILGIIMDPLINPFKSYLQFKIQYDSFAIDYTILLFAGIVLATALMFTIISKILNFIDNIIESIKLSMINKEKLRRKIQEKEEFIKEVIKNNTLYVILKITKNQPTESYLVKNNVNDFFSVGLVDSYETSISKIYTKFAAQEYKNISKEENNNYYIFNEIDKLLEFFPFFIKRIDEVNKGMLDLNIKFEYKIACHCSISDTSADVDFEITSKILNLCGNEEILISELLKSRIETLDPHITEKFKLLSRGIYLIKEKQIDVFKIKFN